MSRAILSLVALALANPLRAAEPAEAFLSPTTQLFLRWDGVTPHKDVYKESLYGGLWAGPTGDSIRAILAKGPKALGSNLLADPLLDGKPPEELRAIHADLKNATRLVELIADKGVVVAAEVREPRPTIAGVGSAIKGLLGGGGPPPDALTPDAFLFVIVPDVGPRAEVLFSAISLLNRQDGVQTEPLPAAIGRKGFQVDPKTGGGLPQVGWWVEGDHFVLYFGTATVEKAVGELKANRAKGGMTEHPLLKRCSGCAKTAGFTSVARGFIDTNSVVGLAKRLAGPFVPGLAQRLDEIGIGNLKAVVFSSGFLGKESRAVWEFDLPGERKGLAKFVGRQPVSLADLPPLPPDASRFSMLRADPSALYDALLGAAETIGAGEDFGVEDKAKDFAEKIALRKAYLSREVDKFVGIAVKDDLLPHLGDKLVIYQSPTEGVSVFGTVICLSCKDGEKVKVGMDRIQRAFEALASGPMKIRKKMVQGVEVREIYARGFGVLTPSYAVVGDWLVMAGHPQAVHGFVLRSKGVLPTWKPDAGTAKRLAAMPSDSVGIQFCDPRSPAQNICTVGPLFLSTISRFAGNNNSGDFDPVDVGLIPNGHELSKHLFPNLTVTRDDGRTIRVEVNESFSLPLEFVGMEVFLFAGTVGLF